MGYKVSIDVGGTFTDLTLSDGNTLLGRHKSPTTPNDLIEGVMDCLRLASDSLGIGLEELLFNTDQFIHASTTATNAIIEGKGAKCGLICTKGTKYTLWRGEGRRQDIFNFKQESPKPLIRPYLCLEITERINSEGETILPLVEDEVRTAVRQFKQWGVETIAVCLLWSILNPEHERRVGKIIEEEWPGVTYCLSSETQQIIGEYQRMSCVVLNVMLKPLMSCYLDSLHKVLKDNKFKGEVLIVLSGGSVAPIQEIIQKPVYLLFSGPAMGPVAGNFYGGKENQENVLVIDMGGTSFDISTVINGQIAMTNNSKILHYPTGVVAAEVLTLGAGGGSIGQVDSAGRLNVGPKSAGAIPGPACYMKGGTEPTVTDACVVLGYILPSHFLGGKIRISSKVARKVIKEKIADPLNLTVERAALGIFQVCKEKMIGGILDMTVKKGINPRDFTVVTGGGATGLFVAEIAQDLGVKRVIIPKETAELCAFGALNANIAFYNVHSKYTDSAKFDFEGVNFILDELETEGKDFLNRQPSGERNYDYYCSARYPMQVTELDISIPDKPINSEIVTKLTNEFHKASLARYKTCDPKSEVEFVMWRHVATCITPEVELLPQIITNDDSSKAQRGKQPVYQEEYNDFIEIPYYDGDELTYGMKVEGPAVITLKDSTLFIPSGFKISTQELGYFIIEVPV